MAQPMEKKAERPSKAMARPKATASL